MATTILIPLFDYKTCFMWLGPCTVLSRLLRKLNDVRDIDSIRVVTDSEHVPTLLRHWLEDPEHKVDVLPSIPTTLLGMCKHFLQPDNTYVVCNPLFPFVSEETINQVLFAIQHNLTVVTTTQGFGAVEDRGGARLQPLRIVYPACLAVQTQSRLLLPRTLQDDAADRLELGEHISISLTEIEALSLESSEGLAAAKILSTYYA